MSKYTLSRVALLRRARDIIAAGETRFICIAISRAAHLYDEDTKSMTHAKAYIIINDINKMMCGVTTFEAWMAKFHQDVFIRMTNADFLQARLQWIDAMIAYYAKEKL